MAQLGGQELSGIGFGLGVDRALLALNAEARQVSDGRRVDVFGVALGEAATSEMALIINSLRNAGIRADMSYGGRGLKGAMKGADRAGARFALVLGETELAQREVQLKDLQEHSQRAISLDSLIEEIRPLI